LRGRGHTKDERLMHEGLVKRISEERGQPIIRLPKAVLDFGVKLNQTVIVVCERTEGNLLNWEIKIKPAASIKREELKEPISA